MRALLLLIAIVLTAASIVCVAASNSTLPVLYQLHEHTFAKPWGCGTYPEAALFMSSYSQQANEPELLYSSCAGCGATCPQSLTTNTVVWDFGAVVQLPEGTNLTSLTASDVVIADWYNPNMKWHTSGNTPVVQGATYAAIVSKTEFRSLFAFQVTNTTLNGPMTITYGVFLYQVVQSYLKSPGANWTEPLFQK